MSSASSSSTRSAGVDPRTQIKPEPVDSSLPPPQKRRRPSSPPTQTSRSSSSHSYAGGGDPSHGQLLMVPPLVDVQPQNEALWPSFFNIDPYDEMQKRVGDWIWSMSRGHKHVEIEVKIGQLKHPHNQRRLQGMPFETEAILKPSANPRTDPVGLHYVFDSDMSAAQHKHFNGLLNVETQHSRLTPFPIHYKHVHEIDVLRKIGTKKVRVRRDKLTGAVVQVCEKVRLGDLNVFCPMSKFDWRLSISTETPTPPEAPTEGGEVLNERIKDRLSYQHQVVQIDLTQVSTPLPPSPQNGRAPAPPQEVKKRHELEVEIVDAEIMMEEALAAEQGENNCYEQLVGVLLSTVRLLVRNAQ